MNKFIKNEINKLNITNYESIELIREKDGIYVIRIFINNKHYILKCIEKEEYKREINNYLILKNLGIKTIDLIDYTDSSLLMEDITYSDKYRLAKKEDLNNEKVITSIAKWYKQFHTLGIDYVNKYGANMYMESDCFTLENIDYIMQKTNTNDNITWNVLIIQFNDLKKILDNSVKTFNYNDFYYTNMIVAKDCTEAFMFDYNLLGKGYVSADIRNVTVKLNSTLKDVFLKAYGEFNYQEMLLDEIIGTIVDLYYACQLREFPEWGNEALEKITSGKIQDVLHKLFSK